MSVGIFSHETVTPFKYFGLTGDFWKLNIDILVSTWIAMFFLLILIIIGRCFIARDLSIVTTAYEKVISIFIDLCKDSFATFNYYYFAFISTCFFFTFLITVVGIIPFVKEATEDINTTLALALTSFVYVQYQKIKAHGIIAYIKEFFDPFFVLAPIHVVGELSKIASMAFRLFGNILGGGIILSMIIGLFSQYKKTYMFAVIIVLVLICIMHGLSRVTNVTKLKKMISFGASLIFLISWIQIFLGIFEGMIQSFVLTMLTLTYLAIGTHHDQVSPGEKK